MDERGFRNVRRNTPIRITKNDREEYARLARNAKAKIGRTKKNYGVDLSREIDVPKLGDFQDRKQYNKWKEKVESFTNRYTKKYQFEKNQEGVVASKQEIYDFKKANEKARIIAQKKNEKLANEPYFVGGKEEGTVGQQMRQMKEPITPEVSVPKKFDFEEFKDRKQFERNLEGMKKRSDPETFDKRMTQFKRVFERELEENFNSDAQEILELLEYVPEDDFYYLYLKNKEFDYTLFYPPEGVEDDGNSLKALNKMESTLRRYLQGKENMDLKGF